MKLRSNNFYKPKSCFWLTSFLACLPMIVSTIAAAEYIKPLKPYFHNVSTATAIANKKNCMNNDRKIDQAQEAAQKWLDLVDNSEYMASWSTAAPYFQNTITAEQWSTTLRGVRQPFGKIISREVRSTQCTTSLPGAVDGEYVVIEYQTSFENKKSTVEKVTLILEQETTWKVVGYFIK